MRLPKTNVLLRESAFTHLHYNSSKQKHVSTFYNNVNCSALEVINNITLNEVQF